MTTSALKQFSQTTKSLSKQSSFSNPDVSNKDSLELRSGQINPFMTCTSRGVLIRHLVVCFRRRILNEECECFLFAIDNRMHAHPGFNVSLIVKLLRNWDRENGLFFVCKTKRDPSDDSGSQLALDVILLKSLQHLKQ